MRKIIALSLALLLSFTVLANHASADSSFVLEPKKPEVFVKENLPNVLKDWTVWSLDGTEKSKCDFAYNNYNDKYCYYISNLDIDINGKEADFVQDVKILDKGYVLLPGSVEVFPVNVWVDGKNMNIISRAGRPYVYLDKGEYKIEGKLKSKEEVRYLFIPNNAAILNIKKQGIAVANPAIDYSGVLRLETQSTAKSETDDLSVFVYRKITDNIPVMMTVRLNLNVTGKERVENLGRIIPQNFSLSSINSSLSIYVQKNGDLIAEVKPGYSNVDIMLRQNNDSLDFVLDNSPVEQEIWVFESDKSRRVIQAPLSLHSVQTQNVPMPSEWKRLPAYEVNKNQSFTLKAISYDNKNLDSLVLNRNIKLSFDGSFYSIQDNINADFKEDGRLLLKPPFKFYSSSINSEPQAITYTSQNKEPGIEVRKGQVNITNVLRVENEKSIPAAGYDREFNNVSWNLELAPGYKLFYASGVDTVSNSWVSNWNLLSVFIVALLTVCFFYLFGFARAFLGLVLLALLHPIFPQFTTLAFVLCGLLFLQRNIKPDIKIYGFVSYIRYTLLAFLSIAVFVFVVKHLRGAIYPSLDMGMGSMFMVFISYKFLIYFYVYSLVGYIIYRIFANHTYETWRKVLYTIGVFIITFICSAVVFAVINGIYYMGVTGYADNTFAGGGSYGVSGVMRSSAPMVAQSYEFVEEMAAADYDYDDGYYKERGDLKKSIAGLAKNKASNLNQKLLNDSSMKKYQSINVARNVAQTGVGFPTWSDYNSSIRLFIKGPVVEGDNFKLYLLSPCVNIILAFLRAALVIFALIWLFDAKNVKPNFGEKGNGVMKKLFTASILGLMLLNPLNAKAEDIIPSSEVIKKMEDKLTREYVPSCLPECVSIPDGVIYNNGDNVTVKINFHSNETLVVPLPVLRADGSGFVRLSGINLNKAEAKNTLKKDDGIFVLINKGINDIEMNYVLDENTDRFILSSKIRINHAEGKLDGLSFSENKSGSQTFQINRMKKVAAVRKTSELSKMDIDTFFVVKRNFDISAMWQVSTNVVRTNNLSEAATIEVPLLEGEKVIDTDGTLTSGKIRISFAPRESAKSFVSLLPVEQDIILKSPVKINNYKEEWTFNVDYTWSFKYSGLTPTVSNDNNISFKPNAGESLEFKIFRPSNVDGYVITFDKVDYNISYGRGVIDANISLNMRASDAGVHDITIPENAEVKELIVEGRQYPVTVNGNKLAVPVVQGSNSISFKASIKNKLGSYVKFPEFDLTAPAVNITQSAQVPLSRWVLFTSGPTKGPSVLFWSMIPAWLIIAFVLSRYKAAPLSFAQWFILLLGLTQTSLLFMVIIIIWFIALGVRDKFSDGLKFKKLFQLAIPFLTLLFVYSLFSGIYSGLLGSWSMRITGNSYVSGEFLKLTWYQDVTMGALPMPKIISLPVWMYRCFMVIWSTWLAVYFVKWIKWGFSAYVKDSVWNNK
ncbi:MAG: acyltransferase [Lactobacillaceae bacterium]|jgi:hypothetical protein|nr:acyltransferase [Lactobacillaceae bacterium]